MNSLQTLQAIDLSKASSHTEDALPVRIVLVQSRHLLAPNRWLAKPALEVEIDLSLVDAAPHELELLVGVLHSHHPVPDHFLQCGSLTEAAAQCIANFASAMQGLTCRSLDSPCVHRLQSHRYRLVIPCEEFAVADAAMRLTLRVAERAILQRPLQMVEETLAFQDLAEERCLGTSSFAIAAAAEERGIPVYRLAENSLLQFGQGCRQRRTWTAITDQTSSLSEGIAKDKELTRRMLAAAGLPVPVGRPVADCEDACTAARELGFPVVVKPQDGNHSRGVCLNLLNVQQVEKAYAEAAIEGPVMVERHIPGAEHRVLVVGNKVIAAARRFPAQVCGDGQHSIAELIQSANLDPRRGVSPFAVLRRLPLDEVTIERLAEQGYSLDCVPHRGAKVLLRSSTSLSRGGTAIDVTASLHPDVAAVCVEAARIVGLDIAGIDVVAQDLSVPLEQQQGGIVEVNAGPGLTMHLTPWPSATPVGSAILEHLFPSSSVCARIPIIGVRGCGAAQACLQLGRELQSSFGTVGIAVAQGTYINMRRLTRPCAAIPCELRTLLLHPLMEAIVFEVHDEQIVQHGLGCDVLDLLVELPSDRLQLSDIGEMVRRLATISGKVLDMTQGHPDLSEVVQACTHARPAWFTKLALDQCALEKIGTSFP